jgi:hypothetical protein
MRTDAVSGTLQTYQAASQAISGIMKGIHRRVVQFARLLADACKQDSDIMETRSSLEPTHAVWPCMLVQFTHPGVSYCT